MSAVSVLIVDDQILLRQGLRKLLEIEEGIEVVGEAADGVEALEFLAAAPPPGVALVDARMPRMDGIELVTRMRTEYPDVPAVILTTFDDDELVFGGLRAGAPAAIYSRTSHRTSWCWPSAKRPGATRS